MNRTRFASALAMAALAAILLPPILHAQITFERRYGGTGDDYGWSVQQTADGCYIIAGYTTSFGAGGRDVYLIKTDSLGDTLWTRTFGGSGDDYGYSVRQTADSGYIVAGYTESAGAESEDIYLVRTDADGDSLWTKMFGGSGNDRGYDVQPTSDGGYVTVGLTVLPGDSLPEVYIAKTNASGDTTWTRTLGGAGRDEGRSVQETADGGYIVAGYSKPLAAGGRDVYLIKTDANGSTLWAETFGGNGDDCAFSVRQTADSGYIIAGYSNSFGAGYDDALLIKTDAGCRNLWVRTYGGPSMERGFSVRPTPDGGYVFAGETYSFGAGCYDFYLVKTNSVGDTQWTRTFGKDSNDVCVSAGLTADGGYVLAGYSQSGALDYDVYLVKTDSQGIGVAEAASHPPRNEALVLSCEPNPCRGTMTVSLKPQAFASKSLTLRVYDSQGCLVHSAFGSRAASSPLDMHALPSGAYFVRCVVSGRLATARVILQR